jgi:hypothetical protein
VQCSLVAFLVYYYEIFSVAVAAAVVVVEIDMLLKCLNQE